MRLRVSAVISGNPCNPETTDIGPGMVLDETPHAIADDRKQWKLFECQAEQPTETERGKHRLVQPAHNQTDTKAAWPPTEELRRNRTTPCPAQNASVAEPKSKEMNAWQKETVQIGDKACPLVVVVDETLS